MISEWDDVLFLTIPYKDSGVNILTQLDDTQMLLEEHIIKVEAMRGSAFVKLIEEEVKNFYFLLHRIHSTIEEWTKVFLEALSRQLSFLSFLHICIYFIPIYIFFIFYIFLRFKYNGCIYYLSFQAKISLRNYRKKRYYFFK